jgi:hypothetical protein
LPEGPKKPINQGGVPERGLRFFVFFHELLIGRFILRVAKNGAPVRDLRSVIGTRSDSKALWISRESSSVRSFSLRPDGEVALLGEEFDFRRCVPVSFVPPWPGSMITVNSPAANTPDMRSAKRPMRRNLLDGNIDAKHRAPRLVR